MRDSAVMVMPPHALVLEAVGYTADGALRTRPERTRARRTHSTSTLDQ